MMRYQRSVQRWAERGAYGVSEVLSETSRDTVADQVALPGSVGVYNARIGEDMALQ